MAVAACAPASGARVEPRSPRESEPARAVAPPRATDAVEAAAPDAEPVAAAADPVVPPPHRSRRVEINHAHTTGDGSIWLAGVTYDGPLGMDTPVNAWAAVRERGAWRRVEPWPATGALLEPLAGHDALIVSAGRPAGPVEHLAMRGESWVRLGEPTAAPFALLDVPGRLGLVRVLAEADPFGRDFELARVTLSAERWDGNEWAPLARRSMLEPRLIGQPMDVFAVANGDDIVALVNVCAMTDPDAPEFERCYTFGRRLSNGRWSSLPAPSPAPRPRRPTRAGLASGAAGVLLAWAPARAIRVQRLTGGRWQRLGADVVSLRGCDVVPLALRDDPPTLVFQEGGGRCAGGFDVRVAELDERGAWVDGPDFDDGRTEWRLVVATWEGDRMVVAVAAARSDRFQVARLDPGGWTDLGTSELAALLP
jgi:hypothetical protein